MNQVPVTVVAGFLGAGKTTLINRLLQADHGLRLAVLVNDFGAVDVDAELVRQATDAVVSLVNGCICCSLRGDFVTQLANLLAEGAYDQVVVECSGLSEPGQLVRGLGYPQLRDKAALASVVTLLDATACLDLQGAARYLAGEQVAAADLVLVSKTDRAPQDRLAAVRSTWGCPGLPFHPVIDGNLPWELLLATRPSRSVNDNGDNSHWEHGAGTFQDLVWSPRGTVDLPALLQVLGDAPAGLLRIKGLLSTAGPPPQRVLVQGVGRWLDVSPWSGAGEDRLVCIGTRELFDPAALANRLNACALPQRG